MIRDFISTQINGKEFPSSLSAMFSIQLKAVDLNYQFIRLADHLIESVLTGWLSLWLVRGNTTVKELVARKLTQFL